MSKIICQILMDLILVGGAVWAWPHFKEDLKSFMQ